MVTKNFLIKIKKRVIFVNVVLAGVLLLAPLASNTSVLASTARDEVCVGLGGCPGAEAGVQGIVDDALNIISIIIGIAGVLMVMLGGFRYITSGGDASKTASAQNTILWALVGLVIAAVAQVIVRFVLTRI